MAKAKRKIAPKIKKALRKAIKGRAKKTKAERPAKTAREIDLQSLRMFVRALIEQMGEESHISANDADTLVVTRSGVDSFMVNLRTADFATIPHEIPGHSPVKAPVEPEARPFEKGVDP